MPTTLRITVIDQPGVIRTLIYDGATPEDTGPHGTLLRFMIAGMAGDQAASSALLTAKSRDGAKAGSPPGDTTVTLGPITWEGETAVIATTASSEGQEMNIPFIVVKEDGKWLIDLHASMERLMGGGMEQLMSAMTESMKAVGDAMATAMQGVAEGLSEAMGGEPQKSLEEPDGDKKPKPRRKKKKE